MENIAKTLLPDVKNFIDITWEDETIDKKIVESLSYGMTKFNRLNKKQNDFTEVGSQARFLLFRYCLYDYNNKSNEFDHNYKADLTDFVNDADLERLNSRGCIQ